jgi:hypothetical protein
MQIICRILASIFLLSGCDSRATQPALELSITYVNYHDGINVESIEGHTDQGFRLASPLVLQRSSDAYSGKTVSSVGPGSGLPEWIEFKWQEADLAKAISNEDWLKLDDATRDAYAKENAALPVKDQRVEVRRLVPQAVIEELAQSPMDPVRTTLRLKSLRLYFVWTTAGIRVRWREYRGCCDVIREGGDIVP